MSRARRSRTGLTAAALAVAATVAVVSVADAAPVAEPVSEPVSEAPDVPAVRAAVPQVPLPRVVPTLAWAPCGDTEPGLSCAVAVVPLDHDEPTGPTTEIAVAKFPASRPGRRIGTLFVNPGGPGGSGVDLVESIGAVLDEGLGGRFDIVGFDPRGVAGSSPLECFGSDDAVEDFASRRGRFPTTRRREVAFFDHWTTLFGLCAGRDQAVLRHMSTANVARDLDLLRQAVGDAKLTYLGFSYGTYLGQVYANLFPNRVRALALDGVLDPVAFTQSRQYRYDQTGTQKVMDEFLRLCDAAAAVDRSACRLSRGEGGASARWDELLGLLRESPFQVPDGPLLDDATMVSIMLGALYQPASWMPVATEIAAILRILKSGAADGRSSETVQFTSGVWSADNGTVAFYGNHCADAQYPSDIARWRSRSAEARRASVFAPLWWWQSVPCATWPVDRDRYTGPWTPDTRAPILLVGNEFDPSTPIEGARAASALIRKDRLVTYEGYGHVAWGTSRCATRLTHAYLRTATLPEKQLSTCPKPENPFFEYSPVSTARSNLDQVLRGTWGRD